MLYYNHREGETLQKKGDKKMRFVGYVVGNKKFGCGERAKAEEYAKATKQKVETWRYKI